MNWNELAAKIADMTPEQREQPVVTFDDNEGQFCEILEVEEYDDPDHRHNGVLYLEQADLWWSP